MVNLQRNLTVPIKTPIVDSGGNLQIPWLKFFVSLVQAVLGADEAITGAGLALDLDGDVRGASQLNTEGAIPSVLSPGVLAESGATLIGGVLTVPTVNATSGYEANGSSGIASSALTVVTGVTGSGITITTSTIVVKEGLVITL